jgi:hypothetical protein
MGELDGRRDYHCVGAQVTGAVGVPEVDIGPIGQGEDWRVVCASASCDAVAGITGHWEMYIPWSATWLQLTNDEVLAANVRSHLYMRIGLIESLILHNGEILRFVATAGCGVGDTVGCWYVAEARWGVHDYV